MSTKRKKLTDREVLARVDELLESGVGFVDGTLKNERRLVTEYYDAEAPARTRRGQSSYISSDVFDSVEAAHAQLLEPFTTSQNLVQFSPQNADDVENARIATDYCAYVIHRQNPGYEIFSDVVKDGLMNRIGVAKVWWERNEVKEEVELPEAVPYAGLVAQAEAAGIEIDEENLEEDDLGNVTGTVTVKRDEGQVRIEVVPPEEFIASPRARCLRTADFLAHRKKIARADLERQGYDPKKLDEIAEDDWEDTDEEDQRFASIDGGGMDVETPSEIRRKIWLYEVYARIDIDGKGERLWKVCKAGGVILHKEVVARYPFVAFVPLRRPHSLWGSNFAHRVLPVQTAKTALTRAILDHTAITTTPRWIVANGALKSPHELMDNRLGGIVNAKDVQSVMPLPQNPLNPFVFQTLQLLDYDNEDTTGVSRLSQGLNKDALSKQNSNALVETLQNAGAIRQKIVARNFANGFLIPLYLLVYQLVLENESRPKIVELAGGWQEVDPSKWESRVDMVADLHLGYGEQDKEVRKWLEINTILASDPTMTNFYGPMQRAQVYKKVMELRGVKDVQNYLVLPNPQQPPPPSAADQAAAKKVELEERKQRLAEEQFKLDAEERRLRLELDRMKLEQAKYEFEREQKLNEVKEQNDQMIAERELRVVERQAESDKLAAIASPNS